MNAVMTTAFWRVSLDGESYELMWSDRDGGQFVQIKHKKPYNIGSLSLTAECAVTYKDVPGENTAEGAVKAVRDAINLALTDQEQYKEASARG